VSRDFIAGELVDVTFAPHPSPESPTGEGVLAFVERRAGWLGQGEDEASALADLREMAEQWAGVGV
jgi:hypothetical protein